MSEEYDKEKYKLTDEQYDYYMTRKYTVAKDLPWDKNENNEWEICIENITDEHKQNFGKNFNAFLHDLKNPPEKYELT